MKKITTIFIFLASVLAVSCSMDHSPVSALDDETAIQSVADAQKAANFLNIRLRGLFSGEYVYGPELSTDLFHASIGYGNRGGDIYRWELKSENSFCENLWSSCYSTIANANYLIERITALDKTKFTEEEIDQLSGYIGQAAFMKAVCTYALVERFCKPYNAATAKSDDGVMLMDAYVPTSDQTKYPGRSSLEDTFKYIEDNIEQAEQLIKTAGKVGSETVTADVVTAFKARVALAKGDWPTAVTASTSLIDGGKYPLIDAGAADADDQWEDLWTNDSGKECIMQLYASYTDQSVPSSLTYSYENLNASGVYAPDYIPETHILDKFSDTDIRCEWFEYVTITVSSISGDVVLFNKFPGNRALQDATQRASNYIQKIKPFRIAEQYLIAAEAYARMGGNDAAAASYLAALASKRDPDYVTPTINILDAIKNERCKELMGEGFRFYDLKRWGEGFARSEAQNTEVTTSRGSDLSISADDYRWSWPIPQAEIDANPQIKGQQNPGYTN